MRSSLFPEQLWLEGKAIPVGIARLFVIFRHAQLVNGHEISKLEFVRMSGKPVTWLHLGAIFLQTFGML